MDTKIKASFWDDEAVGKLAEKGEHAALVSILWLMTANVNSAGWVEISQRKFRFQTGCDDLALAKACEALGNSIVSLPKGFWLRHYIRHQLGTGPSMAANNMAAGIVRSLRDTPPEIVKEILHQYPELKPRACQALGKSAKAQDRIGSDRIGGRIGGAGGKEPITLIEAHEAARRWCASSPAMVAYDSAQVEMWHADRGRKDWQASSGQVITTAKQAEKDLQFWLLKNKSGLGPSGVACFSSQKKETAAGGAHPLSVPPCADWKNIYRRLVEGAGLADSDWVTWFERANWEDVPSPDRQAIVDEAKRQNMGGASE